MNQFFARPEQIGEHTVTVTGSDVNHIKNVLRMKPGEQLQIYDGNYHGYLCRIREFLPDEILLDILEKTSEIRELDSRLYLFQGLPKADKMDWIVQKAVELGAYEIIPVITGRTIVKMDSKKQEARLKRWQAIAESAAKQSGRAMIPRVMPVMTLAQAFDYGQKLDQSLIPYERVTGMEETRKILGTLKSGMSIGVFIGPEGGFDEREIDLARERGVAPISLGKRILRTETAGLCALSVLMFALES